MNVVRVLFNLGVLHCLVAYFKVDFRHRARGLHCEVLL